MGRALAQIVSYVFHPLLMPTYLFLALAFFSPAIFQSSALILPVLIMIFVLTALVPVMNLLLFRALGTIKDLQLPHRKERIAPLNFISLLYVGVTLLIYWKVPLPSSAVVKFMMIGTALSLTVSISTFFTKISIHAASATGIAGILLALASFADFGALMLPAIGCVALSGLVMSGRLLLQAHTLQEVAWGGVAGFIVGFAGVLVVF